MHQSLYQHTYIRPQVLSGMIISVMQQVRAHGRILSTAVIPYGTAEDVEQQVAAALETVPHDLLKTWMCQPTTTSN